MKSSARTKKRYSNSGRNKFAYDALKLGAVAALGYGVYDWRNRGKKIEKYEKDRVFIINELNYLFGEGTINNDQFEAGFANIKNKYNDFKNLADLMDPTKLANLGDFSKFTESMMSQAELVELMNLDPTKLVELVKSMSPENIAKFTESMSPAELAKFSKFAKLAESAELADFIKSIPIPTTSSFGKRRLIRSKIRKSRKSRRKSRKH